MKNIFKYKIRLETTQEIELPKWSTPLCVQMQDGEIQLWALVNKYEPLVKAQITIYSTGETIADNFYVGREHNLFLGTIQDRTFVWHVFIVGTFTHQS